MRAYRGSLRTTSRGRDGGGSLLLRAMKRPSAEALVTGFLQLQECARRQDRATGVRRNVMGERWVVTPSDTPECDAVQVRTTRDAQTRHKTTRDVYPQSPVHTTTFANPSNPKRTHANNIVGSSEPEFIALPQADTGRWESCGGPVRFGGDCEIGGDWKRLSEIRGRD